MIGPKTKTNYIMTVMIQWIRPGPGAASTELNQCSEQDTVMYEGYSSSMLTSILQQPQLLFVKTIKGLEQVVPKERVFKSVNVSIEELY